jgi:lysophospholipase L1-like esterase
MNARVRRFLVLVSAAALVLSSTLFVAAQEPAPSPQPQPGVGAPAPAPDPAVGGRRGRGPLPPLGPATEPRPRDDARHQSFLEVAKAGNIDLLFVGDSITDWWAQPQRGKPVFDQYFAEMRTANFGIAGDTTQGVLWRMQNGELEGFSAKLIVFMLGTNNINRNDNADIAAGDRAIVEEFRKRQPQAKILVLGIFPRNANPESPFRASIKEINAKLAELADNQRVFYMDIGEKFLSADGSISTEIMGDGLHPITKGYQIWAEAMIDKLKELMSH